MPTHFFSVPKSRRELISDYPDPQFFNHPQFRIHLFIFFQIETCDLHSTVFTRMNLGDSIEIRQSKINSRWVAGTIGQTNRRPSV